MITHRLRAARLAAGLTLEELGAATGLSHTAIQRFEKGTLTPSSAHLLKIARICKVRTEYFFRQTTFELVDIEFRKHGDFGKKAQSSALFRVKEQAEKRFDLLSQFPDRPYPLFKPSVGAQTLILDMDEIESFVITVRRKWSLGTGSITDLTDKLEHLGLLVLHVQNVEPGFSGLCARLRTDQGEDYPIVAISAQWSGDRQRATLAHELGHLLLKGRLAACIDTEKACERFAACFLAPMPAVIQTLGAIRQSLEWRELYCLKQEYGLSILGWLMRARQCKVITEKTYAKLLKIYIANGWNHKEPGDSVTPERPRLFEQLVYRALAEQLISDAKAAELLGQPLLTFNRQRQMEIPDDPAYQ